MDNQQQPGQVYKPGDAVPTPEANKASTTDEISAIDAAMQEEPQDMQPETSTQQTEQPEELQEPAEDYTSDTTDQFEDNQADKANSDEPIISWQAAEPVEASKQSMRTGMMLAGVAAVVVLAIIIFGGMGFSAIVSILVVVMAVVTVIVANKHGNHLESYEVYETGVAVGDRFYGFDEIQSFSAVPYGGSYSLELNPVKRFMMRIVVHLENGTAEQVVDILTQRLPLEERTPGFIDKIANTFKT